MRTGPPSTPDWVREPPNRPFPQSTEPNDSSISIALCTDGGRPGPEPSVSALSKGFSPYLSRTTVCPLCIRRGGKRNVQEKRNGSVPLANLGFVDRGAAGWVRKCFPRKVFFADSWVVSPNWGREGPSAPDSSSKRPISASRKQKFKSIFVIRGRWAVYPGPRESGTVREGASSRPSWFRQRSSLRNFGSWGGGRGAWGTFGFEN